MNLELLWQVQADLGEGPAWSASQQILYWVDIRRGQVFAGAELLFGLDDLVGCIAPRRDGGLVVAAGLRLLGWEPASREIITIGEPPEAETNRFNDGKCDPFGRFLAGTMDRNEQEASGSLYSLEGGRISRLLSGIRISNGLTWSPDYKTFYFIDTPRREVQAFDYDSATGEIYNPRIAIHVPEALGWPDGMTSDTQGCLWIAMWEGAQVTRWDSQTGELRDCIPVPALRTTSCIFGGRDLNELYITSARTGLTPSQLDRYPLSGSVFKLTTSVTGLPTFEFDYVGK